MFNIIFTKLRKIGCQFWQEGGSMLGSVLGDILSKRVKELAHERGLTIELLAEKSNLPTQTVRNVWYGKTPDPHASTVMQLADALGVGMNCLMGKCQHTPEEKSILRNYRACGPHGKAIIQLIARYEAGAVKSERDSLGRHRIPCMVPHGDIRKGIIYDTCETVEFETATKEAYIAMQMTNNDLAPKYCKDDIILFENRFPINGEYAAFFRGDRAYIRKFIEEDGHYRLKCLHQQGEDIVLKRMDEIQYIGTCCGVVRT